LQLKVSSSRHSTDQPDHDLREAGPEGRVGLEVQRTTNQQHQEACL
jgi:hypothetical protein